MIGRTKIKIFPDLQLLAQAAAEQFVQKAGQAVQARGIFSATLSGGSTPHQLYRLLASSPFSERVDWSRTHLFWGDERCVPPDHPNSNYLKARELLLTRVPMPPGNVHRIPAEMPPQKAAEDYEETLLQFFSSLADDEGREQASFDLVLLGVGDDGHTASLFPGSDAIHEKTRWVRALYVDKLAAWRITLTPALLNRARCILFMAAGAGKSDILQHIIYGTHQPERYPAQIIQAEKGELLWMLDKAAAAQF